MIRILITRERMVGARGGRSDDRSRNGTIVCILLVLGTIHTQTQPQKLIVVRGGRGGVLTLSRLFVVTAGGGAQPCLGLGKTIEYTHVMLLQIIMFGVALIVMWEVGELCVRLA